MMITGDEMQIGSIEAEITMRNDDPGPDDDDDPEGDCMAFHQCSGSQWGYCLTRKGHDGPHKCTKCYCDFETDDD